MVQLQPQPGHRIDQLVIQKNLKLIADGYRAITTRTDSSMTDAPVA